jgi:hypothetical protein
METPIKQFPDTITVIVDMHNPKFLCEQETTHREAKKTGQEANSADGAAENHEIKGRNLMADY